MGDIGRISSPVGETEASGLNNEGNALVEEREIDLIDQGKFGPRKKLA